MSVRGCSGIGTRKQKKMIFFKDSTRMNAKEK
jgi:hypothetical protein